MDLPRVASQTSICHPNTHQSTDYGKHTSASKILLNVSKHNNEIHFPIPPTANLYQPSRQREEARALQILKKKLQAIKILQADNTVRKACANENTCSEKLVNKEFLLQKILSNRPVSMVLEISDLTTAWKDSDFITDCLCWHNVYRQRHSSPTLSLSAQLCHLAQTWANHLAHTNRFYYRNDKEIGQNLFCRQSNPLISDITGQEVATYWYRAVRQYNFNKEPDVLHVNVNAGHFTQLIWVSSQFLGVGKAVSRSGKIVVVAHYAPPGNISGSYIRNVLPPEIDYYDLPAVLTASRDNTTSNSSESITY